MEKTCVIIIHKNGGTTATEIIGDKKLAETFARHWASEILNHTP